MAVFKTNFSLFNFNTFKLPCIADIYFSFEEKTVLQTFLKCNRNNILNGREFLILGGGSNLLFSGDFAGCVIKSENKEIKKLAETDEFVIIEAGAGLDWDTFVNICVSNNWHGIENLSNIPGTVGAAPVQNIGAYGVEVKTVIEEVHGIDLQTLAEYTFSNNDCKFAYRWSIFKEAGYKNFCITEVVFKLNKKANFVLNYGQLNNIMESYDEINVQNIRKAVIKIRKSKLPEISEIGSAGSFFKNPVVETNFATSLKKEYPEIPVFSEDEKHKKISAAWLIEKAGMKGFSVGNAQVYENHALVIVNLGNATNSHVLQLAAKVKNAVMQKFGIMLHEEVIII